MKSFLCLIVGLLIGGICGMVSTIYITLADKELRDLFDKEAIN